MGVLEPVDQVARIFASDYLVPILIALTLFGAWFVGTTPVTREFIQRRVLVSSAAIGIANAVIAGLMLIWDRPRPFIDLGDQLTLLFYMPTDPSFPANPTAVGFAAVGGMWRVNQKLRLWLIALSILMGLARFYGGVFYFTDILAGAGVGLVVAYITGWVFRFFDPIPGLFIRVCRAFALA
mgnify:CR=1 FL=1